MRYGNFLKGTGSARTELVPFNGNGFYLNGNNTPKLMLDLKF